MSNFHFTSGKLDKLFLNPSSSPVYIVCEIGINHNGSLQTAIDLMRAAHKAGADAVKFQKRHLPSIYSSSVLKNANNSEWSFDYLIPILQECELSDEDYNTIRQECDKLELDLIITPFDETSLNFVTTLEPAAIKIASADLTNYSLILNSASVCNKLIISTGMWEEADIKNCTDFFNKNKLSYALLLAQSTYPAPFESLNLNFLKKLREYSPIFGYSGHERGIFIPVAAVALGSKIIEKHITFNRELNGPDHKASMLPDEWTQMILDIRNLELALGNDKSVTQAEILNREAFAKSAVAISELSQGHILKASDIEFKSPGKGIFQHEISSFLGLPLRKSIAAGKYISKFDFEDEKLLSEWESFSFSKNWGVKCRFHDFGEYSVLKSPIIEFHCSQTDLALDLDFDCYDTELFIHAPEIFDRELVDICSDSQDKVRKSLDLLQKSIDRTLLWAQKFPKHKPRLVVHLGGMFLDKPHCTNTKSLMEIALQNFLKLDFSADQIEILPENLPPRPWYLGGEWYQHGFMTAEDMAFFCSETGLGMTFDLCHAFLYCQWSSTSILDYTTTILPYLRHMHISDAAGISGEGLQIGTGEIDFAPFFDLVKNLRFSWVPEIWSGHLHHGAGFYKAFQRLEKFKEAL